MSERLGGRASVRIFAVFAVALLMLSCLIVVLDDGNNETDPSKNKGSIETLDSIMTGTTASFDDVILKGSAATDVVVLDGAIWFMYIKNGSQMAASYHPRPPSSDWNISFEAYAPREGSSYTSLNQSVGRFSLVAMIEDQKGNNRTGISLVVGKEGTEGVYLYNGSGWEMVVDDVLPAVIDRQTDSGSRPGRYIVSCAFDGDDIAKWTVRHVPDGDCFVYNVSLPSGCGLKPELKFYTNTTIGRLSTSGGIYGGWMVDDLGIRSIGTRYPVIDLAYEYVEKGDPFWLKVTDEYGRAIEDAKVEISGVSATLTPEGEYISLASRNVNWSSPTAYKVIVDGVTVDGLIDVTVMVSCSEASISKWWNGWDWATVFGTDDCGSISTALDMYRYYDHPVTAYIINCGSVSTSSLLKTKSEIAIHAGIKHDYQNWMKKNWTDSVEDAKRGHERLDRAYDFASRWDDPSYVGWGDTYISLANPGNTASLEMMYAQYLYGTRIEGVSSGFSGGVAFSPDLMGCYWPDGLTSSDAGYAWDPTSPYDLMDADRQWSTDGNGCSYDIVRTYADAGALFRIYNHPGMNISNPELLHWIDNDKTNYSKENWKATDGEAASYIFGKWTIDLEYDENASSDSCTVIDVSRIDPRPYGYWLVPVTIAVDTTGREIGSIEITEGDRTYRSDGNGTGLLRDLDGARTMDVGYDVRDGTLYVSYFWNSSSVLKINYADPEAPHGLVIGNEVSHKAGSADISGPSEDSGSDPVPALVQNGPVMMPTKDTDRSETKWKKASRRVDSG